MKNLNLYIILFCLFLTKSGFSYARLISNEIYEYPFCVPIFKLKEIETQHFRIIFSENSLSNALETAVIAEEEFESLSQYYGPFQAKYNKIRIIVSSDYQLANGFASFFGFPVIHIYTSTPPHSSEIHSYTEPQYTRTLIRHELTHIFTLAFRPKFKSQFIDKISEYLVIPAVFASRSFLEGSAISRESDRGYGRLEDPYTYHLLRRDLLDNKFPNFSEFGGASSLFESGVRTYTYGAAFNKVMTASMHKTFDYEFWNHISQKNTSSTALKKLLKHHMDDLWKNFKDQMIRDNSTFEINSNLLLSPKPRRIHSIQKRKNNIYYFDTRKKILYAYNIKTKKNKIAAFGNQYWKKVSVSYDEKYFLISKQNRLKKYVVIVDKHTLIPVSKKYLGLQDACFPVYSTENKKEFFAIDINNSYPKLVHINHTNSQTLYQGGPYDYFDTPISIDSNYVYFMHSYIGEKKLSRIHLNTQNVESLQNECIKFARFLTANDGYISISYAENKDSFYKRAILNNNSLYVVQNNFKGEMFESISSGNNLIYKTSFSQSDNFAEIPMQQFSVITQQAVFDLVPPAPSAEIYTGEIIPYKASKDFLAPTFIIPSISTLRAGLSLLFIDSTGANTFTLGVNFNYFYGTPEFSLAWLHTSISGNPYLEISEQLVRNNRVLNLNMHLLISTTFGLCWSNNFFMASTDLTWMGRITGNNKLHPFLWNHLSLQQLVHENTLRFKNHASEGKYGFFRTACLTLQQKIDYLHINWISIAAKLKLSPPIVPITFTMQTAYDTSQISIYGTSTLGQSLIPWYFEYSNYHIFSPYVVSGSIDLQIYSFEIQQGTGFGELFVERWTFSTGYRGGFWGMDIPYLHSVYIKTSFQFSLLYGIIPFDFSIEGFYAINTDRFGYRLLLGTGISF
ncbi:MAG: hypothetical protein ACRCTQ_00310 [Brevinemataceae bacterium]